MTNLIVIVNGYPQSGKDTATGFLVEAMRGMGWSCAHFSIINPVRHFLSSLGISDIEKTPEYRKLMADVMDRVEAHNHEHALSRIVLRAIEHAFANYPLDIGPNRSVAFLHVRQIETIQWIKANAPQGAKVVTLIVNRNGAVVEPSNVADAGVWGMTYDIVIGNHGPLDQLSEACDDVALHLDREGRADR
ncbi:hypothetical protein RvVAR031_36310 [Agrobacterium vitis]|uniref:hypothetical protein n=1 Tax=Agrobacterium vitis TaxID=373 RepID=UPI0015DB3B09|nr:hypothetical protein [Agrobacterium vitis]BCH56021.1 hypothetical protein RvVAR031_36310 [Agrobacterium vitis]